MTFRTVRRIAVGGIAEVLLAQSPGGAGPDELVVVKRLLPHLAHDDEAVDLFTHEARLASRLSHPNVVRVLRVGEERGVPFLVMEWLDGMDLRGLVAAAERRGTRVSPAVACAVTADVARGLAYVHAFAGDDGSLLGLVHRDISPHNVFVTRAGVTKILDFGIAKIRGKLARTRTGQTRGKLGYMAPEQVGGLKVDARTDLFALGVVLWELLAGRGLWRTLDEADCARAIREESVVPPSFLVPGLPPDLDPLVHRLLAKFPRDRPASASDVAAELERILRALGCADGPATVASFVAMVA